jgi:hypothetical protein
VKALSGTELEGAVVVLLVVFPLEPTPEAIAFTGGVSVPSDGVYATVVVVAFDPADEDPEDA